MNKLKVGYLSLVKGSWINESLESQRAKALQALGSLDCEVVDCGKLVQNEKEAAEVAGAFSDAKVDCLLVHFITFSLGSIVPMAARKLNVPVIFWSEPEPPMEGGRLAANSFCATNMNAHALWRMGMKYSFVYGTSETARARLESQFKVICCMKALNALRVGSVGGRVPGFYTSNFDELALLEKFGIQTEKLTMLELIEDARNILSGEQNSASGIVDDLKNNGVAPEEINKLAALYAAFVNASEKHNVDAFAVRCWPEFGDIYGIGVCAVLGLLTDNGIVAGCEGDVLGTVSMLMGEMLSGSKPFFCDLISFDENENTGIAWHCGAAAPSLCREDCEPELCKHSIMDGGGAKGVVCEFPLKPGPVTMLRLGERRDGGYRLFVAVGEAQKTEQLLKGNPLKIKFERDIKEMIGTIVDNGIEHHYALAHGNIAEELKLFSKWLDIEIL